FLNRTAFLGSPQLWGPGLLKEPENNPEARARLLEMLTRTKSAYTVFEEMTGQTNWMTVRAAMKHQGDKPVIVISRRIDEADTIGEVGKYNRRWPGEQKALAGISNNSKLIIAGTTNHLIQFYEPKLIVDSVRGMVESIRSTNAAAR
ncbi:MAG: hypothetical protein ABI651_18075, partial [Verrucomicrobiota bacterium]